MEGNLVADEDLGNVNCRAEEKSWMRNRKWRSVLSATYVLTFNDEQRRWKMRRQLNSPEQNRLLELARRDREQTNSLFECLLQDLLELANVSNTIFHEDRLDMLEVGRAL
jgi:hypothetical protein